MPLIQCPDGHEQVSDAAPTCPKCGRPMLSNGTPPPPKRKLTKKHYIIIAVAVLVIASALSGKHSDQAGTADTSQATSAPMDKATKQLMDRIERQVKEASTGGLDASCTAPQLYREYKANEVSADAKYKGKWIQVRDKLGPVAKDIGDNPYLVLAADEYGVAQVQARLFEVQAKSLKKDAVLASTVTEAAGALSPGQNITVECKGSGVMMTFPQLDQCLIIPAADK